MKKSSEVRNADVNEAGGDGTFHSSRCSCGHAGLWKFGCGPVGLKATLQTGSDTGGGWTGSARPSSCFLTCAFPFPRSLWIYAGSREDGGRKQNNKVSQWPELNWEKCWLITYMFGLKVQTVVVCWNWIFFVTLKHLPYTFGHFSSVIKKCVKG